MSPRLRERIGFQHLLLRRAPAAAAAALLAAISVVHAGEPANASTEQGYIALHALATLSPYPCPANLSSCTTTGIRGASSGYLVGLDSGQAYAVAWSPPEGGLNNMTMSLTYNDICGNLWPFPNGTNISGQATISGAVVYRGGLSQNATVTVTFFAGRDARVNLATGFVLSATVSFGSTTLSILVNNSQGVLNMVPVGTNLCPGSGSQEFSVDGDLLTAL